MIYQLLTFLSNWWDFLIGIAFIWIVWNYIQIAGIVPIDDLKQQGDD